MSVRVSQQPGQWGTAFTNQRREYPERYFGGATVLSLGLRVGGPRSIRWANSCHNVSTTSADIAIGVVTVA